MNTKGVCELRGFGESRCMRRGQLYLSLTPTKTPLQCCLYHICARIFPNVVDMFDLNERSLSLVYVANRSYKKSSQFWRNKFRNDKIVSIIPFPIAFTNRLIKNPNYNIFLRSTSSQNIFNIFSNNFLIEL